MKKIDFKNLIVRSISGEVCAQGDYREPIADLIYSKTGGVGYKQLALKIYQEDVCVLDEREFALLEALIAESNDFFTSKLKDALLSAIEEN